jgi:hypothetical protein
LGERLGNGRQLAGNVEARRTTRERSLGRSWRHGSGRQRGTS